MERIPHRPLQNQKNEVSPMKRNLILTLIACGASVMLCMAAHALTPSPSPSASPDAGPDGHHGGGGLLGHLSYALGLSGSQQAEVAPILEAAKPQIQAIREQAKTQVDTVLNSVGTQITPLLTGTQQAKLAEILQNVENGQGPGGRRFGHGGPGGFGGPGGRGGRGGPGAGGGQMQMQRLTTALGLTADEQTQIQPILDASHAQMKAIFQNTSLTPEQKIAQVKETSDAARSQINGLLTPAQQTAFAALKGQFHRGGRRGPGGPGGQPLASPGVSGT
jgi:hypothetical protein